MATYITGAAGYIGSHLVRCLRREEADKPVLIDNLSHGFRSNLPRELPLHVANVSDSEKLQKLFAEEPPEVVLHFAASVSVGESVEQPITYYQNNVAEMVQLLDLARQYGLKKFVLSSTAAVYGNVKEGKVSENHPTKPESPYGHSKLMCEQILADAARAYGFQAVALRYFNVAGADMSGEIGQLSEGATHLLKVACEVAIGKREKFSVYGSDYPTRDGTGVRDYIHVDDLAAAHLAALQYIEKKDTPFDVFNVGYGKGYSVLEVIEAFERVLGSPLSYEMAARRPGDVAEVIADNQKILEAFKWSPRYDDIDQIVKSALDWERKTHSGH